MEMLYQYLWKQRLSGHHFTTVRGEKICVHSPGLHNTDAGPDFLNGRIHIDGEEWVGNIEIHEHASDWYRHGHDSDPAYDNVILHVVGHDDARIVMSDSRELPQIVMTYPPSFETMYRALSAHIGDVACRDKISAIPPLHVADWLSTLAIDRMHAKADRIRNYAREFHNDWSRTCFVALARAFGASLNGDPFEMLARSLPLNILAHHCDDIFQLQALLFGQAGMLDTSLYMFDEYYQQLCREYFFLARKYGLRPMRADIWKYARTRPGNFPHRRIAMLSHLLLDGFTLLGDMLDRRHDTEALRHLFIWDADGYWQTHSAFDRPGSAAQALSDSSVDLLLLYFVAPVLFAYSAAIGDLEACEKAFDIWEDLRPENNTFIRQWRSYGLEPRSAADSQALLQLRKQFCDADRCLDCRFAAFLIKNSSDIITNQCPAT